MARLRELALLPGARKPGGFARKKPQDARLSLWRAYTAAHLSIFQYFSSQGQDSIEGLCLGPAAAVASLWRGRLLSLPGWGRPLPPRTQLGDGSLQAGLSGGEATVPRPRDSVQAG